MTTHRAVRYFRVPFRKPVGPGCASAWNRLCNRGQAVAGRHIFSFSLIGVFMSDFKPTAQQQQVFSLSWLSNAAAGKKLTTVELQNDINTIKGNIGNWMVVWGPAYQFPADSHGNPDTSKPVENAMFVAQALDAGNNPLPQYVIAIAGTNKMSVFDWFSEDLDVTPVNWPYVSNPPQPMQITTGDNLGLSMLLKLTSNTPTTPNITLQQFLAGLPNKSGISLSFTGHSLGGALSPLMTLALMDPNSTLNQSDNVSLNQWASVSLLATAGPSIGDQNFVKYFGSTLGNTGSASSFIWNANDIVPHAWNAGTMQQLTSPNNIYNLTLDPSKCLAKVLQNLQQKAAQYTYTQFQPAPAFTGTLQPYDTRYKIVPWSPESKFLAQAAYQHINAYVEAFQCTWFTAASLCNDPGYAQLALDAFNLNCKKQGLC